MSGRWGFSRQEYWRGCHALLQGIFPAQGSKLGLQHCRPIVYWLWYQGSPGRANLLALHMDSISEWKSLSRVQLCDLMDYTVQGILQARILERVAFPFSRGFSQSRDRTQVSHNAGGFFTSWTSREATISETNGLFLFLGQLYFYRINSFDPERLIKLTNDLIKRKALFDHYL